MNTMDILLDIKEFDFVKHIPSFLCIDEEEEEYFLDFEFTKANAGITIPKNIKKEMSWYFSYTNSSLSYTSTNKQDEYKLPSFFQKIVAQVRKEWNKQYEHAIEKYGTIVTVEWKHTIRSYPSFDKEVEYQDSLHMYFLDDDYKKHVIAIPKFYDDEIIWNFYDPKQKRFLTNKKDDIEETDTWFRNIYKLVEKQLFLSKQTKESQQYK